MKRVSRQTPTHATGIVHLGLGAFSRAHIAIYTEDAIANSGGDWGIVGVSLRSPKTRDALADQQYAYTAAQLDGGQTTTRQVEVISNVLVASENASEILEQMAQPAIKIVSLTITEKGYCLSPSTGTLNLYHPDIVSDLRNSHPVSAAGFLVRALEARKLAGHPPFTVLSCDNLPENGSVIRHVVLTLAEHINVDLMQWIEEHGCFPSTMVDRITPATTSKDQDSINTLTGFYDAAPVVHEPFSQWVIEDDFVNKERPHWESAGAELVSNVRPYELMKLRMLNGTHSALAYLGYLAGFETIADTVANEDFRAFTETLWVKEIIPTVTAPPGVSLSKYADELLQRYTNTSVRHLTWQIAMDGSQKLPQRILGPVSERLAAAALAPGLILSIAAWMHYVRGIDESGARIDVRDPYAEIFAALAATTNNPEDWVANLLGMTDVFPESVAVALSAPVTRAYRELVDCGAHSTVCTVVQDYPT